MVQNKKNFSPGKKLTEDTQDVDRKNQTRNADSRVANVKSQPSSGKDKASSPKRDMGSRK